MVILIFLLGRVYCEPSLSLSLRLPSGLIQMLEKIRQNCDVWGNFHFLRGDELLKIRQTHNFFLDNTESKKLMQLVVSLWIITFNQLLVHCLIQYFHWPNHNPFLFDAMRCYSVYRLFLNLRWKGSIFRLSRMLTNYQKIS